MKNDQWKTDQTPNYPVYITLGVVALFVVGQLILKFFSRMPPLEAVYLSLLLIGMLAVCGAFGYIVTGLLVGALKKREGSSS